MTAARASVPDIEPRFAALYTAHVDHVWRGLRRFGVSPSDLEDAVQETFLVAFRRFDDVADDARWRAWLLGIARRVASHHRRGRGRRLRLIYAAGRQLSPAIDPNEEVARRDAARLVRHFVRSLSDHQREVFVRAEIDGCTTVEIAKALQVNLNTVGSRLRAARASFSRFVATLRARERGATRAWDEAALLRGAAMSQPTDATRGRMLAAIGVQLADPAQALAATTWLAAFKAVGASLALGGGMLVAVAATAHAARPPPATATATLRAATVGTPTASVAPTRVPARPEQRAVDNTDRARSRPDQRTAETTAQRVQVNETASRARAPVVTAAERDHVSATAPRRRAAPRKARPPAGIPTAAGSTPSTTAPGIAAGPAPPTAEALRAELALVQRMRAAIHAGAFDRVRMLVAQHRKRFDDSTLAVERDVQHIAALCGLGQHKRAGSLIGALVRAHGAGALPDPVRAACRDAKKNATTPQGPGQDAG